MSQKIQSAITNVEKLLKAKQGKKTSASVPNKMKILAMLGMGSRPNLRLLNKFINRGVITAEEVVNAVGEALMLKRVNRRVVEAITMALRDALGVEDVIDVEAEESAA